MSMLYNSPSSVPDGLLGTTTCVQSVVSSSEIQHGRHGSML